MERHFQIYGSFYLGGKMDAKNYITIQGWMRTELDLTGNDLIVFAIIYGFSQTSEHGYQGGLQYLADWCGCTRQGMSKNVQRLVDKGLIEKVPGEGNKGSLRWNLRFPEGKQRFPNNIENSNRDKEILSKDKIQPEPFLGSIDKHKIPKESLYDKCINYIDSFTQDPNIRSLLEKYLKSLLEMCKQDNRTLCYNMFVARINKLKQFNEKDWPQIIKATLDNSWKNFYDPGENKSSTKSFNDNAVSESYTSQELEDLKRLEEEREANGLQTKF